MENKKKYNNRKLKSVLKEILVENDYNEGLMLVKQYPYNQSINPLISFFCSSDMVLKWHAISAFSLIVDLIAKDNLEKSRIIMRRLMWTLNEESGGVGWGAPESMGTIMSLNQTLADEYHKILFSYIDDHGNYLDYAPLRQGVLWGIRALSKKRPELVTKALPLTNQYLYSDNAVNRCLALQILNNTDSKSSKTEIERLINDKTEVEIFNEGIFEKVIVNSLVNKILSKVVSKVL